VRRYPFDGSAASVVWQPATSITGGTEGIAVSGTSVYWAVSAVASPATPPTVYQKTIGAAASVAPTVAFTTVARASYLRAQGTFFYWVTGDYQDPSAPTTGLVYSRSISAPSTDHGTAIVTVDQGNFNDFKAFQPSTDALYWISDAGTGTAYEIRTAPLTGGTPAAIPKIAGAPDTAVTSSSMLGIQVLPTLYTVGATLYFSVTVPNATYNGVYKYKKGDTAPTQVLAANGVMNFVVDSSNIYYIALNDNRIEKAPLSGGAGAPITLALGAYKILGQDATYLYVLEAGSGSSTLQKVIK